MTAGEAPNGRATIREVYQAIDTLRRELQGQLAEVERRIVARLDAHDREHREAAQRQASGRQWLVTTAVSVVSALAAVTSVLTLIIVR